MQLLDLIIKIYFSNIFFSKMIFNSIKKIIVKFVQEEKFQEYLYELVKTSLN